MTDLQSLCSTTVAYVVREFQATHNMAYVYKVLEDDVPYVAKQLEDVTHLPYNACVGIVISECAGMFFADHAPR